MNQITSLKLNKHYQKKYLIINSIVFLAIGLLIVFIISKIIFPSQYFTYSFNNTNSLKNTITEMKVQKDISFFASTPREFSKIIITVKTKNKNISTMLNPQLINIRKGYKSFFYPEGEILLNLEQKKENILSSIDNSVYLIGNNKKTPIDSTETFESMGYQWKNVSENKEDLSNYEKQKLTDINSAHPDGTIFQTKDDEFYFIENNVKRKIIQPNKDTFKNQIQVEKESLEKEKSCIPVKMILFSKSYGCEIEISELNKLIGKDYEFKISGFPDTANLDNINIEFKKSISLENFRFFIFELKKKILYRFDIKDF